MKKILQFLIVFSLLLFVVVLKYYFFQHPNRYLFFLANSDIMLKAVEFLKRPTPVPYVQSYIEYPVLVGIWNTALAYFSRNATDFFFLNGISLSFFSTLNVFLAQELAGLVFKRRISLLKLTILPSVIFFTFYNWEALALFFLLSSLWFFYRGQNLLAITFSYLGFWVKVFPLFNLVTFSLKSLAQRNWLRLSIIIFFGFFISLILNLRFLIQNASGLLFFFNFSRNRPPNIDSVWSGIYVLSDRIWGANFFLKPFFDVGLGYLSLGLFFTFASLFLFLKWRRQNWHYLLDTTFLIALFLVTSKVYSPQFNLWVVLLMVVSGLNFKKVLIFDLLDLVVAWAVYQYFYQVFIVGSQILSFPYFKMFYFFVLVRHFFLIWLAFDLFKLSIRQNHD